MKNCMFSRSALVALVVTVSLSGAVLSADDSGKAAAIGLQNAFTTVAEKASPAVVVITNKQTLGHATGQMPQGLPPEFRFFFGLPDAPGTPQPRAKQVPQPVGKGSGVIMRDDGYVVTNYHVIKDFEELEVKLHDGKVYDSALEGQVELVGYDEETDLAVLRIGKGSKDGFPSLEFGNSDDVKVGHWAIAVGAPFNFDYSVTVGVVSQKGRYDVRMNTYENYIQTDASINPGNSGGPLLNLNGEVIGINDFIVTGGGMSRGNVGIGFAISSNLAEEIVDDLINEGHVIRPWMGIAMQPMDDALRLQFDVDYGVLISDVMQGDPAEKAGIETGDVILEIGGRKMNSTHDVQFAVLKYKPGQKIPVLVDRKGKKMTFMVKVRQRDSAHKVGSIGAIEEEQDVLNELGLALEERDEQVVVAGVMGGGRADAAGLLRGDIICEVNRQAVKTVDEVVSLLAATKGNVALICRERGGIKQFVILKVRNEEEEGD